MNLCFIFVSVIIVFIIMFNSTIHYHKLHSSTQAKHTCRNCLISNAVYLDILKLQVQTNSSSPVVSPGLVLLGHKLFVCFPIGIIGIGIDIVQRTRERRINTIR